MKKVVRKIPYLLIGIVVILLLVFGAIVKKVLYYSAGPLGEKDCPPLASGAATDKATTIQAQFPSNIPWEQKGGAIDDSSCLDRTAVYGIINVTSEQDVARALEFAKKNRLKVSIAGVRHSQGGQAFAKNAVVLDMRKYKHLALDANNKTITVGGGATWHDIQNFLHPTFSVKAMQSTDIFSVGGSISVNAHGMDHQAGSVGVTLRSARIMLPSGEIKTISRTENPELFRRVVGGYGLFGVILEATLDVTDNVVYESGRQIIKTEDFPTAWSKIESDPGIGLFYAHLSTAPSSFLNEAILYTYKATDVDPKLSAPLADVPSIALRRLTINLSKLGRIPMELKWLSEKYLEPRVESCEISRTQAMTTGEGCLVSRNEPMHDSVPYLRNSLKNDTDILQEYFIPRKELLPFITDMREVFLRDKVNILNVSIRVIHKEDIALNYAPQDAFSVVLYINQTTDSSGNAAMARATGDLIDLATKHGGKFFLPYQLYYSRSQLKAAYPEIDAFFAAKRNIDPDEMFTNTWYEKYKG